jgi:hypothetical protein
MSTIEFTDRHATARAGRATRALAQAALAPRAAPSPFDRQPWRWRIGDDVAELRADRRREPRTADPDGRMLTIACGAALNDARAVLAGSGTAVEVARMPDPADSDLLARLRVTGFGLPTPDAVRWQQAIALRCVDHRPLADVEVPGAALVRLRAAAQQQGGHLYLLLPEDAVRAGADPGDQGARFAVLCTDADTPACWLTAGEALSAVLLAATVERLAGLPVSGMVDAPAKSRLLREVLGYAGYPAIVFRIGVPRGRVSSPVPGVPAAPGVPASAPSDVVPT